MCSIYYISSFLVNFKISINVEDATRKVKNPKHPTLQ